MTEDEYRQIVMAITEYAAGVVSKTLGPYGKTTNIDDSNFVSPTKDGWTVLRNIRFSDPLYNIIFNAIIQISFDLVTKVGDGTTSALVGANYFLHAILYIIKNKNSALYGKRQADILKSIEEIKDIIVASVKSSEDISMIDMDGDFDDIYNIAFVASNGNAYLAKLIKDIYAETKNPNIFVTLDPGDTLKSSIQTGFKYDCLILDQDKYRNSDDGTYRLDEPLLVAVFDHNVTYNEHSHVITALTRFAQARNQSVLIVAPYFDSIITNILHTTICSFAQRNQIPNIILMQVPLAENFQRETLSDFVLLTNAQIFDYGKVRAINVTFHNQNPANANNKIEDDLLNIEQYHFNSVEECIDQCVGKINTAIIGQKYVVISNYETVYNKNLYDARIKDICTSFEEISRRTVKSSNMLTKEYMEAQQRYIKMLGKMGTIHVGAQTELEKHCLKDSVDDAVLACRSAVNNGYIRGLNLTTLSEINKLLVENELGPEKKEILEMFYFVFREMSMSVIRNKYENDMYVLDCKHNDSVIVVSPEGILDVAIANNFSFDLVEDKFEDPGKWVIVNSLSTDVEILNSIVGVLSILLTSDQFISINKQYDRKINRELVLEKKSEDAAAEEQGRLDARVRIIKEAVAIAKAENVPNEVIEDLIQHLL